jgi:hypothetical protein
LSPGTNHPHRNFASLLDGHVGQVPNDGVNILSDIADFGELGCLDLDERRICQLGQTPGNFCLANARWTNHQDVLGCDFGSQRFVDLLAPPAIAQGNGHRSLGLILSNNVLVKFRNDFLGSHGRHKFCWQP